MTPPAGSSTGWIRAFVAAVMLAVVGIVAIREVRARRRPEAQSRAVPPAGHGALIGNPRSGGGTADRLGLVTECRMRGRKDSRD